MSKASTTTAGKKKGNGKSVSADKNVVAEDATKNGGEDARAETSAQSGADTQLPPDIAQRIARLRSQLREAFGSVAMAMMLLPRYRHQSLADLQHLLLEPLLNDRVAIAHRAPPDAADSGKEAGEQAAAPPLESDIAGIAIWANVSEEVDARIREQIKARVFPIRLKPDEWNSGKINWLLDIIAPDSKTATNIVVNFKQVVKGGEVRLHPILGELLDKDVLDRLRTPAQQDTQDTDE